MLKLAIFIDSQEMSILNSLENKFKTIAITALLIWLNRICSQCRAPKLDWSSKMKLIYFISVDTD